jgi:hypothetical protein
MLVVRPANNSASGICGPSAVAEEAGIAESRISYPHNFSLFSERRILLSFHRHLPLALPRVLWKWGGGRDMSLEQAAYLSQVIGAIAVLASLVFVGLQVRQNTQSQKVVALDSLSAAIAAINIPAMETPALGEALAKATRDWDSASREQRIIAHYFLFSFFKLCENAWYQRRANVLDQAQWVGWESMLRMYYHSRGLQSAWWPRRRYAYSPDFQTYLTNTSAPENVGSLYDLFENVVT